MDKRPDTGDSKVEKVTYPADPNRCQAVFNEGQCRNKAIFNGMCQMHGANIHLTQERKKEARLYLSAMWKDRIGDQANHPKLKTLCEEVGILRMTLDKTLDSCKDDKELLLH